MSPEITKEALHLWGSPEGRCFALEDVLVWFTPEAHPLVVHPVVQTSCFVCHEHATPGAEGVAVSRVSGDSKYGYESYHLPCL